MYETNTVVTREELEQIPDWKVWFRLSLLCVIVKDSSLGIILNLILDK